MKVLTDPVEEMNTYEDFVNMLDCAIDCSPNEDYKNSVYEIYFEAKQKLEELQEEVQKIWDKENEEANAEYERSCTL